MSVPSTKEQNSFNSLLLATCAPNIVVASTTRQASLAMLTDAFCDTWYPTEITWPWLELAEGGTEEMLSQDYLNFITQHIRFLPDIPQIYLEVYTPGTSYRDQVRRVMYMLPCGLASEKTLREIPLATDEVLGWASPINLPRDKHFPLIDVDHADINTASILAWFTKHLLGARFFQSSATGLHVVSDRFMSTQGYFTFLDNCPYADPKYIQMTKIRGYGTLRISSSNKKLYVPKRVFTQEGELYRDV